MAKPCRHHAHSPAPLDTLTGNLRRHDRKITGPRQAILDAAAQANQGPPGAVHAAHPGDGKTPYSTNGFNWMLTDYVIEDAFNIILKIQNISLLIMIINFINLNFYTFKFGW